MDQESEEQREKRTRALWAKFDTKDQESLDLPALKKGLKKLDHRRSHQHFQEDRNLTSYFPALQNADNLIEEVIKAADVNRDGRIRYDGQLHLNHLPFLAFDALTRLKSSENSSTTPNHTYGVCSRSLTAIITESWTRAS